MNDKFVDMPKCMADKYETADFIASDPVQFPRRYSGRDAEVSGFITSWLSFGNRKAIIGAAEMREELRTIGSKGRHVFTATFVRFGFRNGYIGPVKTMLLQDVTLDSKIVSDHLWFDLTKGFSGADLSPGDVVEFCARVSAYEKGYKGHKDDVLNRPIERDYRLSRPTKIKKIGKKLILKDEGK